MSKDSMIVDREAYWALIDAVAAVLPDLRHYVSTHGPGPDYRLASLTEAWENAQTQAHADYLDAQS